MSNDSARTIVYAGICIALTVIFSYVFAIRTTFVHITFGFLPISLYAMRFGPRQAGIVAATADVIGTGVLGLSIFFPGFILSGFLTGWIFGYFLYQKKITIRQVVLPFLLITLCIHLGLNTLWLTFFYGKAVSAIFLNRLIKNILCFPMEISLFFMAYKSIYNLLPTWQKNWIWLKKIL